MARRDAFGLTDGTVERKAVMAIRPPVALGLVLATLLTTALAGCGQAPDPKPLPKPTRSSASPTHPAAPTMPPEVKQKNRAGAEAAVRWFLDALNYAGETGDTQPLRHTFSEHCTRCAAMATGVEKVYAAGGYSHGGDWINPRLHFYGIDQGVATIDAIVDYSEQTWNQSRESKPAHIPPSSKHLHAFQLRWATRQWLVGALDPAQ